MDEIGAMLARIEGDVIDIMWLMSGQAADEEPLHLGDLPLQSG